MKSQFYYIGTDDDNSLVHDIKKITDYIQGYVSNFVFGNTSLSERSGA